jgi:hypothetical protein
MHGLLVILLFEAIFSMANNPVMLTMSINSTNPKALLIVVKDGD